MVCRTVVAVLLVLAATLPALGAPPTTRESIRTLEDYYAKLYAEPLGMKARLPKLIALMSLAKLDSEPTNRALIEAVDNRDPVVSYLAWEILHARHTSLTPEYHDRWTTRGIELAAAGHLPGDTIKPALDAGVSIPHAMVKRVSVKLFDVITSRYSPATEAHGPVLKSAGQLLAAWNEPLLIQRVAGQLNDRTRGPAAEMILMQLPGAPGAETPADQRKAALQKLARAANAGPATRPYTTLGTAVPKPVRITDPSDKQWRKDLELGKLTVTSFDLAWVMDSTGSMAQTNETVAAETAKIMRLIDLCFDTSRVGAVYFRHEVDPKLQLKCCQFNDPLPAYRTKALQLNANAAALAAAMASEPIGKPGEQAHNRHPGSAVHGGLYTAIAQLKWNPAGRRVIVLIGDAPLTAGTPAAAQALGAEAAKNGFQVHAVNVSDKGLDTWNPVIKASGGRHFFFRTVGRGKPPKVDGMETVQSFGEVGKAILKSAVNPDYADRIDALIDALEPYIEQAKGE